MKATSRQRKPPAHRGKKPRHSASTKVRRPRLAAVYHALPAEAPLHEVLREGLTGLPPAVNVIVMSRNDPPPVFARLNVHNHLVHLDAQTLKLTPEEAAGLARQLEQKLPRADIQRINEQAGGWTAGVVLLLSRHRQVVDAVEQAVPQTLFDYFAGHEPVLNHT
jgi:LuxR family transcriptional regulator, maltose regulon positive regulatory protein